MESIKMDLKTSKVLNSQMETFIFQSLVIGETLICGACIVMLVIVIFIVIVVFVVVIFVVVFVVTPLVGFKFG